MPSLQIRDLPEPLHRLLRHRAQAHKRSLSQQALADLETVAGGDPRQRRHVVLERIAQCAALPPNVDWAQTAEDLIREAPPERHYAAHTWR
ncbi:MAG: FitA-like ribbon-helix-helix domain-containing protein [Cyanobacteriota bacterium]|jgi:plasmid stability protein